MIALIATAVAAVLCVATQSFAGDAPATKAAADVPAFKSRLLAATARHLNSLLGADALSAGAQRQSR